MKTRYVLSCLLLGSALSVSAQKTAVKSNLLSAANGALNAGVEYAFGPKSTFDLSGSIRPWKRTEGYVNKYWLIQPEYRYWTCQKFNGSFWGAYLNGAQFNVGGKKMPFGLFPWLKEHRYAGWLAGGGISYGYHILLNRHWNIEVSVGVGYEYIDYKKYSPARKRSDGRGGCAEDVCSSRNECRFLRKTYGKVGSPWTGKPKHGIG